VEDVATFAAHVERIATGEGRATWARAVLELAALPLLLGRTRSRWPSVPSEVRVVTVGAPSLGGSGKTPLAVACARALAAEGARVTLVGHAYRARPTVALEVDEGTPVSVAGDEAHVAFAQLRGTGVRVVVGPTRAAAMRFAAPGSDVLVVDGGLGEPACLSLLAVGPEDRGLALSLLARRVDLVVPTAPSSHVEALDAEGQAVSLSGLRYGLVTAVARPDRVAHSLSAHPPVVHLRLENHAPHAPHALLDRLTKRHALGAWVATEKGPLRPGSRAGGRPVHFLRHTIRLSPDVSEFLRQRALGGGRTVIQAEAAHGAVVSV
jgi:tetraacyldisaccharide 4'-kinase